MNKDINVMSSIKKLWEAIYKKQHDKINYY